jgi:hypothetical protein
MRLPIPDSGEPEVVTLGLAICLRCSIHTLDQLWDACRSNLIDKIKAGLSGVRLADARTVDRDFSEVAQKEYWPARHLISSI